MYLNKSLQLLASRSVYLFFIYPPHLAVVYFNTMLGMPSLNMIMLDPEPVSDSCFVWIFARHVSLALPSSVNQVSIANLLQDIVRLSVLYCRPTPWVSESLPDRAIWTTRWQEAKGDTVEGEERWGKERIAEEKWEARGEGVKVARFSCEGGGKTVGDQEPVGLLLLPGYPSTSIRLRLLWSQLPTTSCFA